MAGYPIEYRQLNDKQHAFEIDIGGGNKININTVKDIVSVNVNADGFFGPEMYSWFGNSTGLMGSLKSGKMLARDGVTVLRDPNEMGQEWQVRDRCVPIVDHDKYLWL